MNWADSGDSTPSRVEKYAESDGFHFWAGSRFCTRSSYS